MSAVESTITPNSISGNQPTATWGEVRQVMPVETSGRSPSYRDRIRLELSFHRLEAVSFDTLISKRRLNWMWTNCHWQRDDVVALALLCRKATHIDDACGVLGRSPTSVAWRANDTGLVLPHSWRALIRSRSAKSRTAPRVDLQYPYIQEVRGEHDALLAVNSLVPAGLPTHLRGDICQEIMLAIFERQTTLEELRCDKALVNTFIRRTRNANYEGGGYALSLDMPMRDGRNWYDVLPDHAEVTDEDSE